MPGKVNDGNQSCVWHLALSSHRALRAPNSGVWGQLGRNMSLMSPAWPWWETKGDFGSCRWVTAQSRHFPISGQMPVGTCGAPRPTAGRSCLGSAKAPSEHTTQLSAQPYGGMQGGRRHLHQPSVPQLSTHSGVQVPGTRQPVCFGHSRASLGMSHCATWAQTAEKELWDSQRDARKNKGTVKGRGVEMGVDSCSKIQKGKWPSMSSWRRKAGRLVRMNGKGWGSGVGQVASSSHWRGQSGWETVAPWHPNLTPPLPVPLRSARLHGCRSGEQTSAWQLVKSYLSFMAVSP